MNADTVEHSNGDGVNGSALRTAIGFVARFAITFTVVYFVSGIIFTVVSDYRELFATTEYSFMRSFDHPLVILGPTLQLLRGALLALAFLPFRSVIVESRRGWLFVLVPMLILVHVGADAADPGKIESFIYADFSVATHLATWPESIFSSAVFSLLFFAWERNPTDKRLSVPLVVGVVIVVVLAILGLLFMPTA